MKNFAPEKKFHLIAKSMLWATLVLPLGEAESWKIVDYGNIPAHRVSFTANTMKIQVQNSATPIVYPFEKPRFVTGLDVHALVSGALPALPTGLRQGQKGADDVTLRVGLIVRGNRKLNWLQRKIAPRWLLDLEKLMPQNYGIHHVEFICTCLQKDLLSKKRTHFLDSSLKEECVTLLERLGPFTLSKKWTQPMQTLGIWIATDGDDSQSRFDLTINKIEISHK